MNLLPKSGVFLKFFLDASSHLYKRVCPSVCPLTLRVKPPKTSISDCETHLIARPGLFSLFSFCFTVLSNPAFHSQPTLGVANLGSSFLPSFLPSIFLSFLLSFFHFLSFFSPPFIRRGDTSFFPGPTQSCRRSFRRCWTPRWRNLRLPTLRL